MQEEVDCSLQPSRVERCSYHEIMNTWGTRCDRIRCAAAPRPACRLLAAIALSKEPLLSRAAQIGAGRAGARGTCEFWLSRDKVISADNDRRSMQADVLAD